MGRSIKSLKPIWVAGPVALLCVAFIVLGPVLSLWNRAEENTALSYSDWRIIRFTVMQAILSASISVILAIPVARALARRVFWGRSVLITLLGAPFLLPTIVAVIGLLAIWGRGGFISSLLMEHGHDPISIYGLTGLLLAHVFFNLPLATRLILQGWGTISPTQFRLAAQLGFKPLQVFRHLELPMLRSVLPGAFVLVFLLCLSSFAVALTLGGGPKATTIELAIYQAIRFDFDLAKAAILGLVQFCLCGVVSVVSIKLSTNTNFGAGILEPIRRWDAEKRGLRIIDATSLIVITLFLVTPLMAIIVQGLPHIASIPASFWPAFKNSVMIASLSAALTFCLAISISLFVDYLKSKQKRLAVIAEIIGLIPLAISPFVIGTGLFVLVYNFIDPFAIALPITAIINAMMSLPFALRSFLPTLEQNRKNYSRLADSLGMKGFARFRLVTWPALQKPAGFAIGLSMAFSLGDLGVITLFAPPDFETIPLLMYRLMGSYQMNAAAAVAMLLVSITLFFFWLCDRGGRLGHNA